MKVRSLFIWVTVLSVLGAQGSDFILQLPPISTTATTEAVDLVPLERWNPAEEDPGLIGYYLIPVPESDLVISTPLPEAPLPQTVQVETTHGQ